MKHKLWDIWKVQAGLWRAKFPQGFRNYRSRKLATSYVNSEKVCIQNDDIKNRRTEKGQVDSLRVRI